MARTTTRLPRIFVASFVVAIFFCSPAGCANKKAGGGDARDLLPSFADLVDVVKPAVVNISTVSTVKLPGNPFQFFFGQGDQDRDPGRLDNYLRQFFGDVPDRELKQRSLGSGVIIDQAGYIVTNYHVVRGAEEITVRLMDGRELKARVAGRDAKTDLALIKVASPARDLPAIPLGDSAKVRVGDWVLAVGNPFGLAHTVTQGIISATGRVIGTGPYDNFLQTDAPVNPGNSGGPLVNLRGEVVGITTAIVATGQGIGFAIPSNVARNVITQLREKGNVVRGWIGVTVQEVTPDIAESFGLKGAKGALVGSVEPAGPAQTAGVRRGDIIVRFDGKEVKSMSDLPLMVAETPVGSTVPVALIREGKELTVSLKVKERVEQGEMPAARGAGAAEPDFGMSLEDITPALQGKVHVEDRHGVVVTDVVEGGAAEEAGIEAGDVVQEVNRTPVESVAEYRAVLEKARKGAPVLLFLKRGAATFYASLKTS